MIKHIVLFKLKDASPESVERTAAVLRGLEGKVEQLRGLRSALTWSAPSVPMTSR
ncbi:hypothetical protein HMSSN036_60110 [Paenibacillus macerans]|nr:hypothetical protein HMSSN036_60110 [Paenibacillus macerans]